VAVKPPNGLPLSRAAEGGVGWSGGLAPPLFSRAFQPGREVRNLPM